MLFFLLLVLQKTNTFKMTRRTIYTKIQDVWRKKKKKKLPFL